MMMMMRRRRRNSRELVYAIDLIRTKIATSNKYRNVSTKVPAHSDVPDRNASRIRIRIQ